MTANRDVEEFRNLRNPPALEVLESIDLGIRQTPLRDADDAYDGAESEGGALVFGLCESNLPQDLDPNQSVELPIRLAGFRNRGLDGFFAIASTELLTRLLRSVQIGENHVGPPYLFFSVINADWHIRKMCIQPVLFDEANLVLVKSRLERRYFSRLLSAGKTFYRALDSMRDYERMPGFYQVLPLREGEQWPYCPDAVVYGDPCSTVEELRGFKRGKFRRYDDLLDTKGRVFPCFIGGRAPVEYHERDGTLLQAPDEAIGKTRSGSVRIRRGLVRQNLPYMI